MVGGELLLGSKLGSKLGTELGFDAELGLELGPELGFCVELGALLDVVDGGKLGAKLGSFFLVQNLGHGVGDGQ